MLRENPYFGVEERLKHFEKETNYEMTRFADRIVELPWTFELQEMGVNPSTGNKLVHLDFHEGEVIEEGTDLSEMNLGNVDVAVAILYKWRQHIDETLLSLALKTEGLEMTTLNGMIANSFGVTFSGDMTGIKINKGRFDPDRGEVWS